MLPLSQLAVGKQAKIIRLDAVRPIDQRMLALGLMPGVIVEVVQVAPLGDPIALEFHNQRISIRKAEAEVIQVTPFVND